MKKSKIFLILAIIFLLISIILFATLKTELIAPNCIPDKCDFVKYTNAIIPYFTCLDICALNENRANFTTHNPIYALFLWLGIISIIISIILFFLKK